MIFTTLFYARKTQILRKKEISHFEIVAKDGLF